MQIKLYPFLRLTGMAAVLSAALASCDICEFDSVHSMSSASVEIRIDGLHGSVTRSCVGDDTASYENVMKNMSLFQFTPDGTLYRSYYFPSPDGSLYVQGRSGVRYSFLGLMNMGDMTGEYPAGTPRSEVERYVLHRQARPDMSSGCPMSCLDASMSMSSRGGVLSLVFTRLAARYDFRLDCSHLRYGSFEVSSLDLRQAPTMVMPFLPPSRITLQNETEDGDYATVSNLSALRNGQSVPFYVLENAQGTLLPGNTDPWAKVPSSLGSLGGLCTYIELKGTYKDKTGALRATHTYRMYLGDDNVTNFDVSRGTAYDLTLTLSDDGFLHASWKAERQVLSDTRSMYFNPSSYTVKYGTPTQVSLVGGNGCTFMLSGDLTSAGVTLDPATMTLNLGSRLPSDVTGTLTATSWDRAHSATCSVTALKYREAYTIRCYIFFQWYYDEDQTGEILENFLEEWMYFRAVRSDGTEIPCRFRIPGFPGCGGYQDRHEVLTQGVNRGPGPGDMPDRQLTYDFFSRYPLYIMVDGEESNPSWSSVTFIR